MARKSKEEPIPLSPLVTPAQRRAIEEGEARRQDYLASLDPREREQLDPK
jgi:hypothetical protein